jgi:hypothetical protein
MILAQRSIVKRTITTKLRIVRSMPKLENSPAGSWPCDPKTIEEARYGGRELYLRGMKPGPRVINLHGSNLKVFVPRARQHSPQSKKAPSFSPLTSLFSSYHPWLCLSPFVRLVSPSCVPLAHKIDPLLYIKADLTEGARSMVCWHL